MSGTVCIGSIAMPWPMKTARSTRSGWSAAKMADAATCGVPHHGHPLDLQRVEDVDGLLGPECDPVTPGVCTVAEAVSVVIDRNDAVLLCEALRQAFLPVRDAPSCAVEKEDHLVRLENFLVRKN